MIYITISNILNIDYSRVGGEDVRMMVWDTAGQEEFDTITRAYYRWATI